MSQTTAVAVPEVQKIRSPLEIFGDRMRAEYRGLLDTHHSEFLRAASASGMIPDTKDFHVFMIERAREVMEMALVGMPRP